VHGGALFQEDAECHAETGKQDNDECDYYFQQIGSLSECDYYFQQIGSLSRWVSPPSADQPNLQKLLLNRQNTLNPKSKIPNPKSMSSKS
jgi:hypothetical protein